MSEPRRWLSDESDASSELRELLQAARSIEPLPPALDQHVARRVAKLALLPAGIWALLLTAKGIAIATSVAVATSAAVTFGVVAIRARYEPRREEPRPRPRAGAKAAQPRLKRAEAPGRTEPPRPAVEPNTVAQAPTARRRIRRAPSERTSAETEVAAETALLERARAELEARPRSALKWLERYDARFPRGQLRSERELIAIDALTRLGRRGAARARGRAFLEHYPHSPYRERVLRLLARPRTPRAD